MRGSLSAQNRDGKLVLETILQGTTASLSITAVNPIATSALGLTVSAVPAIGQKDAFSSNQNYAFYNVFDTEDTTYTLIDTRRGDDEVLRSFMQGQSLDFQADFTDPCGSSDAASWTGSLVIYKFGVIEPIATVSAAIDASSKILTGNYAFAEDGQYQVKVIVHDD